MTSATATVRERDLRTLEPKMTPLYEAALEHIEIRPGTRLLDVGCGPGLFLRLAAERGATVTGIDAAPPCIEIARERIPHADLTVGEMESLPYPEDSFDVVTGFNAFQFAADPRRALREAARVGRPRVRVVIASCALGPFALSTPGALEALAARAGLVAGESREVENAFTYLIATT